MGIIISKSYYHRKVDKNNCSTLDKKKCVRSHRRIRHYTTGKRNIGMKTAYGYQDYRLGNIFV